jgi:hypothetical protein
MEVRMVGIGGDDITPDVPADWPWFCDAVEETVKHTHTSSAALEHILDQLHWRWTRWRYAKLEYEFLRAGPIADYQIRLPPFFWRRYISVKHDVDVANNCAVRVGPGIVDVRLDDKGNEEPVYNSRNRLVMRATSIRLYRPDILRGLQRMCLISPPPLVLVPQPCQPSVKPESELAPRSGSEPLSEPGWDPNDWSSPDTVMLNLGFRPRASRMRKIVVECPRLPQHPNYKGETIPEILDAIGSAELDRFLFPKSNRADSSKRTDSSCERFLAEWKAWRSRHP